jgi:peroxiredoxin
LAAKVEGKPISENLKLMDRLLRAASLRVRERREAREEAKLAWLQAGRPILEPDAEGGAPVEPKREITGEEMIERIYGPNPFNPDGSWKDGYPLPVCDNDHEKEWAEIKHLKVGDLAPDTVVRTFAGERVVLSDYRGKYVLLDFWATWAGPTWAEREELKKIHEAYGKDERLVMLSLSLDHDAKVARDDIQKRGYEWTQCLLGNWKHDRVTRAWGVEGIPAIYLIGPEGKIVAADLRGKKIRAAVDASLISAESGMRADDRQQSGNEVINHETGETGEAKGEKGTVLRELREGDKQPETKADNGETGEKEKEVGLVELSSVQLRRMVKY